jgi:hypothetical protein
MVKVDELLRCVYRVVENTQTGCHNWGADRIPESISDSGVDHGNGEECGWRSLRRNFAENPH